MPAAPSATDPQEATNPSPAIAESGGVTASGLPSADVQLGLVAVLALVASLVGILGVGYSIYAFKFLGHHTIFLLPSRVFFVFSLGLAVVPFLLVLFANRIPYLLLLIPTALVFLLYPLLSPYGVIYGQDALFNFQFAQSLLLHSIWVAGANTSGEAVTYSYFPGSGIFNAEGSVFLGIPLTSSFPWTLPVMRLLVMPPVLYAVGNRLLGPRAAVLGVFLYMAVPSITFNDIVQQEFAVVFFALTLAMITFLLYVPAEESTPLRILVLVFSSFVILSHHVTSYVLGVWLAGLAILPFLLWGRPAFAALRSAATSLRYTVLFLLFVFFVSAAVVLSQLTLLEKNILLLLSNAPLSAKAAAAGNTYPAYQLVWIIVALLVIALFAILTFRETLRGKTRPYLATSLLISILVLTIAFILFPTGYSFVAIRTTEYALIFAAPAAGWFMIRGFVPALDRRIRRSSAGRSRARSSAGWVAPAIAIVIALFVFTGGNLVPGPSRDQFQPVDLLTVNSPMHLTAADYQDGVWARAHLTPGGRLWGDLFVYDVYAGIGGLKMQYDAYRVFNGTALQTYSASTGFQTNTVYLSYLSVGDYVVTEVYATQITPTFVGPGTDQPAAPLTEQQAAKFNYAPDFSIVFEDSTFTVYVVTSTTYAVLHQAR
ncbi:MAG: hypothetical protein WA691_01445 [Thermoplasmata archaeon]